MTKNNLYQKSISYLETLCNVITERCVGSEGNRQATFFLQKEFSSFKWVTDMPVFDAIDWEDGGAILEAEGKSFPVLVGPYSPGFKGQAEMVSASDITVLENLQAKGRIIFLYGKIAQEQLMPKNFVFYNPDSHQRIVSALEKSGALAIISATGRNSALAGGVYPFPLIEDGDFNIPSVYMTEEEGEKLKQAVGKTVYLESRSKRIPGKAYNVIARKGKHDSQKIVITAHVDAKKGTRGAIDNATGVIVLLLLAELLQDYNGEKEIELVAFNGEDYYAVPGQMNYIAANQDQFSRTILNINIDGAGYKEGQSAFSLFDLPESIKAEVYNVMVRHTGIVEGVQWPQGDHSIFLQFGIPAIAVSSKWFTENINNQDITHTPKDNTGIVNCNRLVEISLALNDLIRKI